MWGFSLQPCHDVILPCFVDPLQIDSATPAVDHFVLLWPLLFCPRARFTCTFSFLLLYSHRIFINLVRYSSFSPLLWLTSRHRVPRHAVEHHPVQGHHNPREQSDRIPPHPPSRHLYCVMKMSRHTARRWQSDLPQPHPTLPESGPQKDQQLSLLSS